MPGPYPMPSDEKTRADAARLARRGPQVSFARATAAGDLAGHQHPPPYPVGEGVQTSTSIDALIRVAETRDFYIIMIVLRQEGISGRDLRRNHIGTFAQGEYLRQGRKIPGTDAYQIGRASESGFVARIEASELRDGNVILIDEITRYMYQTGPPPPLRAMEYQDRQLLRVQKSFQQHSLAANQAIQFNGGNLLGRGYTPHPCMQGFEILCGFHATDPSRNTYLALQPAEAADMINRGILAIADGTFPPVNNGIPVNFTTSAQAHCVALTAATGVQMCGQHCRPFIVTSGTEVDFLFTQGNGVSHYRVRDGGMPFSGGPHDPSKWQRLVLRS